jgi:hypothetical protein
MKKNTSKISMISRILFVALMVICGTLLQGCSNEDGLSTIAQVNEDGLEATAQVNGNVDYADFINQNLELKDNQYAFSISLEDWVNAGYSEDSYEEIIQSIESVNEQIRNVSEGTELILMDPASVK